jgi:hypothetical protein
MGPKFGDQMKNQDANNNTQGKRRDQTSFLTSIGPRGFTPSLDNLPYLHLDCCLIFFIRSKAYQIKILQILWTDIQFLETVLNFAWFSILLSLYRYIQIGDETRFRGLKLRLKGRVAFQISVRCPNVAF